MNDILKIDPADEEEKVISWIRETFAKKGFSKAVIGISGGIDSAVVGKLLVDALGKDDVYAFNLPYGEQKDIGDVVDVFQWLRCPNDLINIEEFVDSFECDGLGKSKLRLGNIMARIRMIILYDMSAKYNALVVGTGNKTEELLGYFTQHGDGACAMHPIAHLYKTQVRQLAEHIGVPQPIIDKAPSAGLWDGQTDEEELSYEYEQIDKLLYNMIDKNLDYEGLKKKGFKDEFIRDIQKRKKNNSFKFKLPCFIEK